MASLLSFPRVWIRRTLSLSVNVLLSSVATFCLHFLFTENSFNFWYDSGKTFAKSAKSFDSFAILSSRNDPFPNICSLHTLSFWVDLPRTVYGSVCLSVEKITPFVKIHLWRIHHRLQHRGKKVEPLGKGLQYSPLHVTEFCGEMQGKFKVGLARLKNLSKASTRPSICSIKTLAHVCSTLLTRAHKALIHTLYALGYCK